MTLFQDIEGLVGSGYETNNIKGDGSLIAINLATGPVDLLSDVRSLLPGTLDHFEEDIELVDGQFVSLYGLESELTLVYLSDDASAYWAHAFKYSTLSDYNAGLAIQDPSVEVRA